MGRKIILMTTLFAGLASIHPKRLEEHNTCLQINTKNPLIDHIVILYEGTAEQATQNHPTIKNNDKVILNYIKDRRPTHRDFYNLAKNNWKGHIVVIVNGDIYFDETSHLERAREVPANTLWTLSRYDLRENGWSLENYPYSFDVWIFLSALPNFDNNIAVGVWGSDIYLSQKAILSGIKVSNPSRSIRSYHLDSSLNRDNRNHYISESYHTRLDYVEVAGISHPWASHIEDEDYLKQKKMQKFLQGRNLILGIWDDFLGRNILVSRFSIFCFKTVFYIKSRFLLLKRKFLNLMRRVKSKIRNR